jgi:hypothetical protein
VHRRWGTISRRGSDLRGVPGSKPGFAPLGGVDLELPPAEFVDAPPSFDP